MKVLLVIALFAAACGKPNDIAALQREATLVAKYYQAQLDAFDRRIQSIFKRGTTIPANLPGIEAVGTRLTEARDTIVQLRGIVVPGPDGKNAVDKQAEAAAKERRIADLRKLVHDTHVTLERGTTIVSDALDAVESWISQYDSRKTAMAPARPVAEPPMEEAAPPPAPAGP